jgi:threonine/homoserine/homoserine lactone efflux protein
VSNILNPKIAVFFTSLLPQFVGTHGSGGKLLLLGLLFNAMGVGWLLCFDRASSTRSIESAGSYWSGSARAWPLKGARPG